MVPGKCSTVDHSKGTPNEKSRKVPIEEHVSIEVDATWKAHWELDVNCPSVLPILPSTKYRIYLDAYCTSIERPLLPPERNANCHDAFKLALAYPAGGTVVLPLEESKEMVEKPGKMIGPTT